MANATLLKFGYPDTLLKEGSHWALLVRPQQVTLGSLVLCSTSDATAYSGLPPEAFAEQREFVDFIETLLGEFVKFERINYLMLMMVDPHVHFHVIPRYEGEREFDHALFPDRGWPAMPLLSESQPCPPALVPALRDALPVRSSQL